MIANEQTLWEGVRKGSTTAFSELYDLFAEDLFRYGYKVCSDQALVQDTIQDLFVHLWAKRGSLAEVATVRFYLYRALRNRIVRKLESQRWVLSDDGSLPEEWHATEADLLEVQIENEQWYARHEKLHHALERLPVRQQEAIQLRYYHDFSSREIAALLEVNEQSVRNLLFRALKQLKTEFAIVSTWVSLAGIALT